MTGRPLSLYAKAEDGSVFVNGIGGPATGILHVYRDGEPTGDLLMKTPGHFPEWEIVGLPGQFYRVHEALDTLEQIMEDDE